MDNYGEFSLRGGRRFDSDRGIDNFGLLSIDSESYLKVNGDFLQGADSTLQITIGGKKIGKKGLLRSASTLLLDGTLEILVDPLAKLQLGDSWRILTSKGGREGGFTTVNAPDLGPNLGFEIQYTTKGVTLLVIPSPNAAMLMACFAPLVLRRRR